MTFKGNLRPQKDVKIMTDDSILLLWLLWLKFQPAVLYIIVSYYIILYRYFKISQVWYIKYRLFVFCLLIRSYLYLSHHPGHFYCKLGKTSVFSTKLASKLRREQRHGRVASVRPHTLPFPNGRKARNALPHGNILQLQLPNA